jgi:hypothetical protein
MAAMTHFINDQQGKRCAASARVNRPGKTATGPTRTGNLAGREDFPVSTCRLDEFSA